MTTGISTQVASSDIERLTRPWWTCWGAMSWGFREHAAVYWFCHGQVSPTDARACLDVDIEYPINVIIAYRELVQDLVPERDLARMIVAATPELERKHLSRFYAGNSAFLQGEGSMRAIHKMIDEITVPAGMPRLRRTDDGPNSRIPTARMIDDGLRRTLAVRGNLPPSVPSETPLFLISAECKKLCSTIPRLGFNPKNKEDVIETGTFRDGVWSACCNAYREYPSVVAGKPEHVLRMEAINRSSDPTQRFLNHLEFDASLQTQRRARKF